LDIIFKQITMTAFSRESSFAIVVRLFIWLYDIYRSSLYI